MKPNIASMKSQFKLITFVGLAGIIAVLVLVYSMQTIKTPLAPEPKEEAIFTDTADLDGDGTAEEINLYIRGDSTEGKSTVVSIEGKEVIFPGTNPQAFFGIVDLNTTDGIKEVAMSDLGPSGDYTTGFYIWKDGVVVEVGATQGLHENMTFDGVGSLITQTRGQILHTWFYDDVFTLNAEHKLKRVPQDIYTMNWSVTLIGSIELVTAPDDETPTLTLKPGNTVIIAGCDDVEWCRVDDETGELGWFAVEEFSVLRGTDISAALVFDGLSFAD